MARFAERADVVDRYEGVIPSDRLPWVDTRIDDVENVLLGIVPSLEADDSEIGPSRLARVKTLICDKVLDLYRNPARLNQQSSTSGPYSESTTFLSGLARQAVGGISFSDEELRGVRLRTHRSNLGSAHLVAWPRRHC
jgi:hypothetical protein